MYERIVGPIDVPCKMPITSGITRTDLSEAISVHVLNAMTFTTHRGRALEEVTEETGKKNRREKKRRRPGERQRSSEAGEIKP